MPNPIPNDSKIIVRLAEPLADGTTEIVIWKEAWLHPDVFLALPVAPESDSLESVAAWGAEMNSLVTRRKRRKKKP